MSGILAHYAQSIDHAAANLAHATQTQIDTIEKGAQRSARDIENIRQTLREEQRMALEKRKLDQANEQAIQANEENSKFLKVLALADQKDQNGKPIGAQKAMQIVDEQLESARAKRAANMPKHHTSVDYATMGVGAAAVGAGRLGKYAWDKTQKALDERKINNTNNNFIKDQAQELGADTSTQKALVKGAKILAKLDKKNGTNFTAQYMSDLHQSAQNLKDMQPAGKSVINKIAPPITPPANKPNTPKGIGSFSVPSSPLTPRISTK